MLSLLLIVCDYFDNLSIFEYYFLHFVAAHSTVLVRTPSLHPFRPSTCHSSWRSTCCLRYPYVSSWLSWFSFLFVMWVVPGACFYPTGTVSLSYEISRLCFVRGFSWWFPPGISSLQFLHTLQVDGVLFWLYRDLFLSTNDEVFSYVCVDTRHQCMLALYRLLHGDRCNSCWWCC